MNDTMKAELELLQVFSRWLHETAGSDAGRIIEAIGKGDMEVTRKSLLEARRFAVVWPADEPVTASNYDDDGPTTVRWGGHLELPPNWQPDVPYQIVERVIATLRERKEPSTLSIATSEGSVEVAKGKDVVTITFPNQTVVAAELEPGDWSGLSTALLDVLQKVK